MNKRSKKWRNFERTVAFLFEAQSEGVRVNWNEIINGRQFDVVIRFNVGMHEYLTVVECKEQKRPISVDAIDGLATKYKDIQANKAIVVSSSGFQSGCKRVAENHGIDLFSLKEIQKIPKEVLKAKLSPVLNIYGIRLFTNKYKKGFLVTEDRNALPYMAKSTIISNGYSRITLRDYMDRLSGKLFAAAGNISKEYELDFGGRHLIFYPRMDGTFELDVLHKITWKYKVANGVLLKGNRLDPYVELAMAREYVYCDEVTGSNEVLSFKSLAEKVARDFEPKKFYFNPRTGFNYYCQGIEGDLARVWLVESYQHGNLVQAELRMKKNAPLAYWEVTDKIEIVRLKKLLSALLRTANKSV